MGAGTAELIVERHTGLVYRDGAEALARCMRQCGENPDWARDLGRNGFNIAPKKYTIE
jgi:glycosyltransferase involved in cell wall biosynthesis